MPKIVVTDKALREMVSEVLDNTGWSGEENSPAVTINPITDPSVSVTDPVNPNFTPQNKTEFGVAIDQLVKNLPDTDMPAIYTTVKKALDQRSEKDEMSAAQQAAMVGGSQEAIDANMGKGNDSHKQEGKMSTSNKIEEQLRERIRSIILDVLKEAGELPPVKKIPFGVHGGEYMRRQEKTRNDLRKTLGHAVDKYENEPEPDDVEEPNQAGSEQGEEAGTQGEEPKRRAYKPTAIGGMGDVSGKSFEEIANELKFSVAGAKQAVDKALLRAKFMGDMDEDDREIMVLTAMNDYINFLKSSGELTAADVQLLKDHPDMVRDLDGFREYLHTAIRRAMRKSKAANVADTDTDVEDREPNLPDDGEEGGDDVAADVTAAVGGEEPPASAPATPKSGGKATYKVYGKMKGAPAHTRLKGKAFLAPQDTQFKPGEQAVISPSDGKLSVKKTDSDHTQTWEPEMAEGDETLDEDDSEINMTSVADANKHPQATSSSAPPSASNNSNSNKKTTNAKMGSGGTATVDWGNFGENKKVEDPLLSEALTIVKYDNKGPYVIADGVEARPANPNHTQYVAGTKVNVHRRGKKGVFIVEMPNGEKWSNKPMKG